MMDRTIFKSIIFILAITFAIILQVLIYFIEPLSATGLFLQELYSGLFYIPLLLILITFPQPKSIKGQIFAISILVICLVLASMNVDYQVLRIFSLGDAPPSNIEILVWDKTYNLYWTAWSLQMGIVFVIFGLIYRFKKNDTWAAVRIGAVGPLISLFSFEDIIYYPMHGENPFNITAWSWLPQHNIYFGRPVNTVELIWIVSIAMTLIFLFLIGFAIKKKPDVDEKFQGYSTPHDKKIFLWTIPLILGGFLGLILLYLNTNIINNQIPFYLLLLFAGTLAIFTIFSGYFPKIKSTFKQLVLVFGCYIIFWFAATEMDWNAVETGFHWIVPSDPRKPPGDFWVWCHYRMSMWLIYLPIIILLISIMFKFLGSSREHTLKLSIINYLILIIGIDSIMIFLIAGFVFPPHWIWSIVHYSLLDGAYSILALLILALAIGSLLIYIWRGLKPEDRKT
jgi:hypothetical protein